MPRAPGPPFPVVAWLARRPRWQWVLLGVVVGPVVVWYCAASGAGSCSTSGGSTASPTPTSGGRRSAPCCSSAAIAGIVTAFVLGTSVLLPLRRDRSDPDEHPGLLRASLPGAAWVRRTAGCSSPSSSLLTARIALAAMDQWQDWLLFRHAPVARSGGPRARYRRRLPPVPPAAPERRPAAGSGNCCSSPSASPAFGYFVGGSLRPPSKERRSAPAAVAHLGLLAAALAAAQALRLRVRAPALVRHEPLGGLRRPGLHGGARRRAGDVGARRGRAGRRRSPRRRRPVRPVAAADRRAGGLGACCTCC